ncbi:SAM-dependent methyltransferase [Desulfonema limicola]|uniref:SAM-dependent methyltransferase n=1 Tax=Desulfonema limicola TaxID=45656 RepID=A0A975GG82_9BACT|nr:class I SAM-dependent methyltransferase [Desulfonema limicola]QTA79994.1 SAM-dependent methyltransferase [Desulfonema limicola]
MDIINENSIVDLKFHLKWKSREAVHSDCYNGTGMNMWRDWMPEKLRNSLIGRSPGDQINMTFSSGEFLDDFSNKKHFKIKSRQFNQETDNNSIIKPQKGRFYPKGLLQGVTGIFKANKEPFRCVDINNGFIDVDFNKPLAGYNLELKASIGNVKEKISDKGGESIDWVSLLTTGPGMQARWQKSSTDFFSDSPFMRQDETPDNIFYQKPRFVHHLDDKAREMVRNIHALSLKDDMKILDLMSSWVTHLPENIRPKKVSGLGMNEAELKKNPDLDDYIVHDLNLDPVLPYDSESFDAVICTGSIEYLIHPFEVFKEAARVLRPQGRFIVTFSNRWFPPKAVRIWEQLHEFERMGLAAEYFLGIEDFENLHTYSIRGLPRPVSDKYFSQLFYSDPVYGVWAHKKG